jgi:hypothetical protein
VNEVLQVAPQSIPAGLLITVPLPVPVLFTVNAGSFTVKSMTWILVPADVVSDTERGPGVALPAMVSVATAKVGPNIFTLLAETSLPEIFTDSGAVK